MSVVVPVETGCDHEKKKRCDSWLKSGEIQENSDVRRKQEEDDETRRLLGKSGKPFCSMTSTPTLSFH